MSTKVTYWEINKGQKPLAQAPICFAPLKGKTMPEAIRYIAPVKCSKDELLKFVLFTKQALRHPNSPKFLIRPIAKGTKLLFRIETKGLTYAKALLYLTWIRYVDEYPNKVSRWAAKVKDDDPAEVKFKALTDLNKENTYGSGHDLMCTMRLGGEGRSYADLDKFHSNLDKPMTMVWDYFV